MGHIFINVNSDGPPTGWNRSQNAQKFLVLDLASQHNTSSIPPYSTVAATSFPPIHNEFSISTPAPVYPSYPLPDISDLPAMVELFLDLYYRRFGPDKSTTDLLQPGTEYGGWRSLLPQWIGQSPILDTAIGALTSCFIGAQYRDSKMMDQAQSMYLNVIQMVQKVLPEADSSRYDVIATTLVMGSIELFMSNGKNESQLTHVDGATRLLHCLLENRALQPELEELHIYVLIQGLFKALSTRQPYEFALPEYASLMQQLFSVPRMHGSDLYFQWCFVVLPLPNILHSVDSLSASSAPPPPEVVRALLDDIAALESNIIKWHDKLLAVYPGPWTLPTAQSSPSRVPFPLHFLSIEVCALFSYYWVSQLLLLQARHSIYASSNPHGREPSPHRSSAELSLPAQIAEYASLICRSVQFCTQGTSFAATENMLWPLCLVYRFYKWQGDHERMSWCVKAVERMGEEQRISFMSGIMSM